MKMLARFITIYTVATFTLLAFSALPAAHAVTDAADVGQALEIAPPVIVLTADPGQTVTSKIAIRDVSPARLLVRSEINDFVAQGEEGAPKILLEEGETSPYSMKHWFKPLPALTLEPREVQNLPVTITVPSDAAPGSYFAVVRFTATAPDLDTTGVSLSASLGTLVFLRVNGDAHEKLSVVEFTTALQNGTPKTLFESLPLDFVVRLKNEGNVHEQPAGQVTITDMFGKTIAAVNVNLPPRNILPDSIRRFEVPFDKSVMGKTMLFGHYTADLKITYGDSKQVLTDSLTFWVIPWKLIGFGILGLIIAFFILRNMLHKYNRAVVRRATGTAPPKKSRSRRKKGRR